MADVGSPAMAGVSQAMMQKEREVRRGFPTLPCLLYPSLCVILTVCD